MEQLEAHPAVKNIFSAFIPSQYEDFASQKFRQAAKHFLFVLLIFVLIMAVTEIPRLVSYPSQFSSEFSKFNQFKVDVNASASSVVDLWLLKIDTNNNTEPDREGVVFSKDYLQIRYLRYLPPVKENISEYKDFVASSANVRNKLIVLGILLIPSLLFTSYLYYFIKFSMIVIIVSALAFFVCRIAKHEIKFSSVINICILASTCLMLELAVRVFSLNVWIEQLVPFALFLTYAIIGIVQIGGRPARKSGRGVFGSADDSDEEISMEKLSRTMSRR